MAVEWRTAAVTLADGQELHGHPPSDRVIRVIEAGGSLKLLLAEHANRSAART